ncbi:hypothetical protein MAM1_0140d06374 [Mucor ambiguus]|uniref:AAA+ ATPase domain-containing protein n=1 Tax=Mucor ambiguus TaxID=91626 RepID=A0A0C9MHT9_9FUNG|nr:hypothetical protein MAM1_0140d06374 [Mucor ambiguus]
MSNPKQVVHPFFQPRKPQKSRKDSLPPTIPTPEKQNVKSVQDDISTTKDVEMTPTTMPSLPSASIRVTRSQLQKQQQTASSPGEYVKTGECSTPYYVPITKPKFYSDTVECQEQLDHEAYFDYYGNKRSNKKKQSLNDHEFSRMKRRIFGNGHITDKAFEPGSFRFPMPDLKTDMRLYIKEHQRQYFQKLKHQRESRAKPIESHRSADVKMRLHVSDQDQVESLLNTSFPNWHSFSSCVLLLQLIFDKNRPVDSSNKQWIDKYRPRHLNGLLGERHNHRYLNDWLHQMKIEPRSAPSSSTDKIKKRRKKKHKKLVMQHDTDFDDEDAFLKSLSLYEDENDEDFMMKPGGRKELKKESMRSNIILLVGDHGIGKTASVYTIAEQMDYEVFEINAGSRRSGKDIMSAVGEMTKSHLVAFGIAPPASAGSLFLEKISSNSSTNTKPVKKKKLNPSLRSSLSTATTSKPTSLKDFLVKKKPGVVTSNVPAIIPPTTKQSLILLEEVDILFEEDKGFWAAVIELSQKSKRPIIMTCNDPEQVPIENMSLQVVIDMKPPTENELLAYLWLVCFAEGHTVNPADLVCLVAFLGRDIRQLIQTLELFAGQGIFGHYLGVNKHMSILETKSRCVQSRVAIDTFRLARAYQQLDGYVKQEEPNELDDIEKILENNAFIDTWLGWKENGAMIQESVQDQLNGYTTLWVEDDEDSTCKHINKEIEGITAVLNNTGVDWVMDEESHWDELCDAKSLHYEDCKEAIDLLLPVRLQHQPQESVVMMEYIPYIQQMIMPVDKPSKSRTRSKRKRLHLPLSSDAVTTLSNQRAPIDETQFHIQVLFDLNKSL